MAAAVAAANARCYLVSLSAQVEELRVFRTVFDLRSEKSLYRCNQPAKDCVRLSHFVHRVVVHRRDEAIRGWRNWLREDPLVHPYKVAQA